MGKGKGKAFAKVKLCHTGDFPFNKNEKIKQWVENNGGTCQSEVASDTTHLVCSEQAWKRYHSMGMSLNTPTSRFVESDPSSTQSRTHVAATSAFRVAKRSKLSITTG